MTLHIAPNLTLPIDAVTETAAILGRRGSGKTHTAVVVCEEMLRERQQAIVIDPLDVWWGLRAAIDGKGEGMPILVVGGHHGDVPLDATAGRMLADLVVDEGLAAVLSLRHLSKTDQRRFVADFGERLYDRKGEEKHRRPLHLFVDEADAFVPQRLVPGAERTFGAIDTLVRRGRSSGIGCTLISQRAAVISKDVLTQTEMLVCHQTTGPQDRKALEAWIEANDADNRRAEFMASLASLERGTAWFWSPAWLRTFKKVAVRQRRTFDSSSTPRAGKARIEPKRMAPIDLDALRAKLATTIERANADDPKALRARIVELERAAKMTPPTAAPPERVEVPVLTAEDSEKLRAVAAYQQATGELLIKLEAVTKEATTAIHGLRATIASRVSGAPQLRAATAAGATSSPRTSSSPRPAPRVNGHAAASSIGAGERRILTAIAQHGAASREQLTVLTGYKKSSRDVYLQRLRAAGLVERRGDDLVATAAGTAELGDDFEPLPTGYALRAHWLGTLPEGERRVLDIACSVYPEPIERDAISNATGYKKSSRDVYLQRLRSRKLVTVDRGTIRASAELFA